MRHPLWPPQSVIVALNPSVAAGSDHVSRITRFDDFGDLTV
jgi:hypothetical protein